MEGPASKNMQNVKEVLRALMTLSELCHIKRYTGVISGVAM